MYIYGVRLNPKQRAQVLTQTTWCRSGETDEEFLASRQFAFTEGGDFDMSSPAPVMSDPPASLVKFLKGI